MNKWSTWVGDIADAVHRADNEEFVLECVGILGKQQSFGSGSGRIRVKSEQLDPKFGKNQTFLFLKIFIILLLSLNIEAEFIGGNFI